MKRSPKSREINRKSSKESKNERSRISKKKRTISSSLNGKDTDSELRNQEKILLTIKRYSADENQNKLKKIL